MLELDTAKPKDVPEKKSKPSRQQECIVCKKVVDDMYTLYASRHSYIDSCFCQIPQNILFSVY